MLSQRARTLQPSPTLALVAKAKDLSAQGHDVISLSVGEPDWNTYQAPVKAGMDAIEEGFTRYTPASGIPELRKAIASQVSEDLGLSYEMKQVSVGAGAKFMIYAALQVLVDPEDEVLIPTPYWVSYPAMVNLSGAKDVIVECGAEASFKLTASALEAAISPKTKALILNSPSNPTGLVYSREELEDLAAVLKKHPNIFIISDDIYNRLTFSDEDRVSPHLLQVAPELADRTIIINGASKTYAMTGWRIGWALGHEKIISAMAAFQSQAMGCPPSLSQRAALAALRSCEEDVRGSVALLKERAEFGASELERIEGVKVSPPEGAFYLWVDIRALLGKNFEGQPIEDSRSFAQYLLERFYVALVPGEEFGSPGYLRISFAIGKERMSEAIGRIGTFVGQLT